MKVFVFCLVIGSALFTMCSTPGNTLGKLDIDPFNYTIAKKAMVSNGAVVSAHPLASAAGLAMLRKGGNAVDAAIATQLALAVVYPNAGNLGGGGFIVARLADGRNIGIDYREKAPGAATRDMYINKDGEADVTLSQHGHLAAGVPGTVAGLFASAKYGRLPMRDLIAPAIDLAANGFALTASEARGLNNNRDRFLKYSTTTPAFVKSSGEWKQGDTLVQPDLANTLMRIRDQGMAGFYGGETARLVSEEMKRGNGIITEKDLLSYEAKERPVTEFDYRGHTVLTMSLPSSGGILLPQMLRMIEDYPIGSYGFNSVKAVQLMTEAERRAYADRAEFLGDPDFVEVPVQQLISREYARKRMETFETGKAGKSDVVIAGNPTSEETTHLSVYDKEGNAVAVTTTLNGGYGSHTVVGGAGFLLNNEMDDFSVKPGVPNMYGALGNDKNAIIPGKRMLSSMTPTIVLRNNKPYIVVGTPGGTTIPTSVFQSLVNIIDFNMSAEDAVNKPKFHHQWYPDVIYVERDFPAEVQEELKKMGYTINPRSPIGRTELILIHENGTIEAVADKRGDDHASGY